MKNEWIKCTERMPPVGRVVETKIVDEDGFVGKSEMQWDGVQFWVLPGGENAYYEPTHWREVGASCHGDVLVEAAEGRLK